MSVLQAVIGVILVQIATTHMEVTLVLATLDTQAMASPALVCTCTFQIISFSAHTLRY